MNKADERLMSTFSERGRLPAGWTVEKRRMAEGVILKHPCGDAGILVIGRWVDKQYRPHGPKHGGPTARRVYVGEFTGRGWFTNLVVEACVAAKALDDELRANPDQE